MSVLPRVRTIALALATALAVAAAPAPDDPDDRRDRLAAGRLAFRDNCLMCHAEEMTARSRLSEKQWATEIDKMIGWGAPVPAELKGPLFEFLVSEYSPPAAKPPAPPERINLAAALALVAPSGPQSSVGDAAKGGPLYAMHCATCHGPDARGADLGTCLVEKPVLLRPADYDAVVRNGRRRMPGFSAALKPEQETDILAWLRSRRYEAPSP